MPLCVKSPGRANFGHTGKHELWTVPAIQGAPFRGALHQCAETLRTTWRILIMELNACLPAKVSDNYHLDLSWEFQAKGSGGYDDWQPFMQGAQEESVRLLVKRVSLKCTASKMIRGQKSLFFS